MPCLVQDLLNGGVKGKFYVPGLDTNENVIQINRIESIKKHQKGLAYGHIYSMDGRLKQEDVMLGTIESMLNYQRMKDVMQPDLSISFHKAEEKTR